ncbi:MAG TPA: hypothetical protein VJH92_05185 [Candidatus Nanoarchaeia archaeon]|nr:hypothetical protein [Candidatus Nanoarchaeia archaeon]
MIKGGVLIAFVIMLNSISAIVINEVELNPQGTDAGGEWIEIYSDSVMSLEGYKIANNDGKEIALNGSFSGYYMINFNKQWLDNSNEKVLLYKDSSLVDETDILSDSSNNQKTWQFCETWQMHDQTKGKQNDCGDTTPEESVKNESTVNKNGAKKNLSEEKPIKVFNLSNQTIKNETKTEIIPPEVIKLNAKTIKTEDNSYLKESGNYAFYALILFALLLGVLFLARRRKFKNEFRED